MAADLYVTVVQPRPVTVTVPVPAPIMVTNVGGRGLRGPQGPQGVPGVDGGAAFYHEFIKAVADTTWVVNHALGRRPNVFVMDEDGEEVWADSVTHLSDNEYVVTFITPVAGRAISS